MSSVNPEVPGFILAFPDLLVEQKDIEAHKPLRDIELDVLYYRKTLSNEEVKDWVAVDPDGLSTEDYSIHEQVIRNHQGRLRLNRIVGRAAVVAADFEEHDKYLKKFSVPKNVSPMKVTDLGARAPDFVNLYPDAFQPLRNMERRIIAISFLFVARNTNDTELGAKLAIDRATNLIRHKAVEQGLPEAHAIAEEGLQSDDELYEKYARVLQKELGKARDIMGRYKGSEYNESANPPTPKRITAFDKRSLQIYPKLEYGLTHGAIEGAATEMLDSSMLILDVALKSASKSKILNGTNNSQLIYNHLHDKNPNRRGTFVPGAVINESNFVVEELKSKNLFPDSIEMLKPEDPRDLPRAIDRLMFSALMSVDSDHREEFRKMGHCARLCATMGISGEARTINAIDLRVRYPDDGIDTLKELMQQTKAYKDDIVLHRNYVDLKRRLAAAEHFLVRAIAANLELKDGNSFPSRQLFWTNLKSSNI